MDGLEEPFRLSEDMGYKCGAAPLEVFISDIDNGLI